MGGRSRCTDMGFETEGVLRDHYRRQDGSLRSAVLMALWLPGPGAEA